MRDFDALKAQELAKIDAVEREYWLAWERSKRTKKYRCRRAAKSIRRRANHALKGGDAQRRASGQPGILAGVLTCIERRCSILGLDAPKRFVIRWDDLTDEQIDRLAAGEPPEKVLSA